MNNAFPHYYRCRVALTNHDRVTSTHIKRDIIFGGFIAVRLIKKK